MKRSSDLVAHLAALATAPSTWPSDENADLSAAVALVALDSAIDEGQSRDQLLAPSALLGLLP